MPGIINYPEGNWTYISGMPIVFSSNIQTEDEWYYIELTKGRFYFREEKGVYFWLRTENLLSLNQIDEEYKIIKSSKSIKPFIKELLEFFI